MSVHRNLGEHGSSLWKFNRLMQYVLTNCLLDLSKAEIEGFTEKQCQIVRTDLESWVIRASSFPDGSFFRKSCYNYFEKILTLYTKWNSSSVDNDPVLHRRKYCKKLRNARQKLSRRARNNQRILEKELDFLLVDSLYEAFGKLVRSMPDVFTNLSRSLLDVDKKRKTMVDR